MTTTTFTIRDTEKRKQIVEVLYEDAHLLVINKPGGLPVLPDRWLPHLPNLRHALVGRYGEEGAEASAVFTVHRLDAGTSGVILFARTPEMHRELNRLFENSEISKTYWAIVQGAPPEDEGEIDLPLRRHPRRSRYMQVHREGKPSRTRYRVLERFRHFSLVELHPLTGRSHQIRVHLAAVGSPLAVDPLYGEREFLTIRDIKRSGFRESGDGAPRPLIRRLTLHACSLAFTDPLSGESRRFQAPVPKDFSAVLKALRKWGR